MRESVPEPWQGTALCDAGTGNGGVRGERCPPGELGKSPQPTPNALRRPLLEQHGVLVAQDQPPDRAIGTLALRARRRQLGLAAGAAGAARHGHRAVRARGSRARTHRRPEIHDRLRKITGLDGRRHCVREPPQLSGDRRFTWVARDGEPAREHALDVAVEYRLTLPAGERQNRPGG